MTIKNLVEAYEPSDVPARHPSLFEPQTFFLALALGVLGVIIGVELITRVGVNPNTSIIGAVIAIAASRIPLAMFGSFRSLHRQNLLQTVISGATYGGANALLLPMGVLWLLGRIDLVPIMMLGAMLGLVIAATIIYRVFDSRIYSAKGLWPPGVATAECMIAGDRGGGRAKLLGVGGLLGGVGQVLGLPMDVFGICWIGNMWALSMFGIGLLVRAYSAPLAGIEIEKVYAPHGVMIGAGIVALGQIAVGITKGRNAGAQGVEHTTSDRQFGRSLIWGYVAFVLASALMAALAGLYAEMSVGMLAGFVLFSAAAALVSELIVGIAAMHSGWFPAFATALIFLVLGMLFGFPPLPLAFLVGFAASTGPAFADMAYDLKAGWILRGSGKYPELERQGRRQQYYAELLGFLVAGAVILLFYGSYFANDLFPPVSRVFATTIQAGTTADIARYLFLWAIPGALIQLVGGSGRQMGVLFATGLLLYNPVAGWTALVSLAIRALLLKRYGNSIEGAMYVLAGGFIAGSALTSFGTATLKIK